MAEDSRPYRSYTAASSERKPSSHLGEKALKAHDVLQRGETSSLVGESLKIQEVSKVYHIHKASPSSSLSKDPKGCPKDTQRS